ncbi:GNAT family N-acetyltransferase [Ruminococcus sp.]|uniref:GNAT family N-acetyltransferase n=1 Tax=Ruminococcus sp. TaxID=41978 RepID=UPI002CFC7661|nr:GNAT family N-acetyltransferase [Ruminococcus sp.]HNZ99767.1 GNAT family N-acetyltransferase [Ruminococcus sp.]HOH86096.1 GNAT family N-acetyltransferase [Ruminococcus sp.]
MKNILRLIDKKECEKLWRMQVEAFSDLLEKYRDYDISPANEPMSRVMERLEQPFTYYYFIMDGDTAVGAVRVVDMKDGSPKRISPIFIMKEHRGKGFAKAAIRAVEELHGTDNWSLDTILQEEGNCCLYEKMGYRRTGDTQVINERMTLVFYEK